MAAGLLLTLTSAARADLVRISTRLELEDSDRQSFEVAILAEPLSTQNDEQATLLTALIGETLKVELAAGTTWRFSATAKGFWSEPALLRTSGTEAEDRVLLKLYPTAFVHGQVDVETGEKRPTVLTARLRAIPESEPDLSEVTAECPVEDDGSWRCELPAGHFDLALRGRSFITQFFWGLQVRAGEDRSLGGFTLRPGASLIGWIEAPQTEFTYSDTTVELQPKLRPSHVASDEARSELLAKMTKPNDRGFFHFPGIAPGIYSVRVKHSGYAVTTISPVTVMERAETEIPEVELALPVDLAFRLNPPVSPFGEAWTLDLATEGDTPDFLEPVATRPVSTEEGVVRFPGLEPGVYHFSLKDNRENNWTFGSVELTRESVVVDIDLPVVEVGGIVLLDDEPIQAALYFGGKRSPQRSRINSDSEGKFHGFLPRYDADSKEVRDLWTVDVYSRRLHIDSLLDDIEVKDSNHDGEVFLRLELADTSIVGKVVDEEGGAFPGAQVLISGNRHSVSTVTGDDGTFSFRAVSPGEYDATARAVDQYAEMQHIDLKDTDRREVDFVLRGAKTLSGQVLGPGGEGVPGARVVATIDQSMQRWTGSQLDVTTGVSGEFTFSLPRDAKDVLVTAFPFGFALTQQWVRVEETDAVLLIAEPVGGRLTISGTDHERPAPNRLGVFKDGNLLTNPFFLSWWTKVNGEIPERPEAWLFSMLPPGTYTVCADLIGAWFSGRIDRGTSGGRCVSGQLEPYGELSLEIPAGNEAVGSIR